ncbi:Uu.00g140490.m01.CDS01 [Anthostomella pinea]|uniref:Uu.00g140490.m01.CDS01 n=1 Tax=Anthostomella pinea TaxID=933095 RepID=A0AAI8VQ37_9PEZI|nr:Uu.00g140490.m01.CDS01 [Anthostomella pinea]
MQSFDRSFDYSGVFSANGAIRSNGRCTTTQQKRNVDEALAEMFELTMTAEMLNLLKFRLGSEGVHTFCHHLKLQLGWSHHWTDALFTKFFCELVDARQEYHVRPTAPFDSKGHCKMALAIDQFVEFANKREDRRNVVEAYDLFKQLGGNEEAEQKKHQEERSFDMADVEKQVEVIQTDVFMVDAINNIGI